MAALVENQSIDSEKQRNEFAPLLKALTASSSMCLTVDGVENEKIIKVLTTLSAMVESVPLLFIGNDKSDCGSKSFQFALSEILLGEGSENDDASRKEGEEKENEATPSRKKYKRRKESSMLSLACRRTIAAIEFLVSYIRSTLLNVRKSGQQSKRAKGTPSDDDISAVFEVLVNIIRDDGYLSSCTDQSIKERSELKKCAANSLLKLCDGSLNIENKYFTSKYWHIFSRVLVDEDGEVRGEKWKMLQFNQINKACSTKCVFLYP